MYKALDIFGKVASVYIAISVVVRGFIATQVGWDLNAIGHMVFLTAIFVVVGALVNIWAPDTRYTTIYVNEKGENK